MAEGFGKIEFNLACRLGELTQNEIRVLLYLYVCRNEDTLQCNPRRKTISTDTKIGKGNLSKAIFALEEKGWISENEQGDFILFKAIQIPEKVVSSTTKVVKLTTNKVVSSTTKVVSLTTESCYINNSHIKDLNREGTEKEQRTAETAHALDDASEANRETPSTSPSPLPDSDNRLSPALSVFEYWQSSHSKQDSKPNPARLSRINARLKTFTPDELKAALDGAHRDDWLMGRDSRSKRKYDGIETLFRDDSQVERLIELKKRPIPQTTGILEHSRQTSKFYH